MSDKENLCRAWAKLNQLYLMGDTQPNLGKAADAAAPYVCAFKLVQPHLPCLAGNVINEPGGVAVAFTCFLLGERSEVWLGCEPIERRFVIAEPPEGHHPFAGLAAINFQNEDIKAFEALIGANEGAAAGDFYSCPVDDLYTSCIDEKPHDVEGWYPADIGDAPDGEQQYRLLWPEEVSNPDPDDWEPSQCFAWLEQWLDGEGVKELKAKNPADAQPGWRHVETEEIRPGLELETLTPEEVENWEGGSIINGEFVSSEDIEGTEEGWIESCRDAVRDAADDARERFEQSNEPMMNYFYPVDGLDGEANTKLDGTCCTAVELVPQGTTALVLTGGGMDFSDCIIEAHLRLGHFPPVHFRLDNMSRSELDQRTRTLVRGAWESLRIQQNWLEGRRSSLTHVFKGCK